MENRVATAVVVATLLSTMATIYIAVAIASSHWLSFMPNNQSTPPGNHLGNHSPAPVNIPGNKSSLLSTDHPTSAGCWGDGEGHCLRQLALLGGHIGLWKVCFGFSGKDCIFAHPADILEYRFKKPGVPSSQVDWARTTLARLSITLPLVALTSIFLAAISGLGACLSQSLSPLCLIASLQAAAAVLAAGAAVTTMLGARAVPPTLHNTQLSANNAQLPTPSWSLWICLASAGLAAASTALSVWATRHGVHFQKLHSPS
uniref:claudin domain-containing protein 1-like n=1 Tax=Myxine glutinosa TaxID=7769 RepID=UPI00358E90AD